MSEHQGRRILALVLTHNAPQALARCLAAIGAQDEVPEEVLVVDNASQPAVAESRLPRPGRSLRVIRSEVNGGPAGGWAIALRYFLAHDFTHAWLMDDDIVPEPKCLASLWDAASEAPASAFVFPDSIQPDGSVGRWGSWCGFLISREIVETVGLPTEGLFWWAEDAEYCEWRIPQAGFPRCIVDAAVVRHDAVRQRRGHPDVEVLLRVAQCVALPRPRHAQGGPLSEEGHQPVLEGRSASEKRSTRVHRGDVPRSVRRSTRAPGDSLSGRLLARARPFAVGCPGRSR
jgi:GT2 family glycosyltransferase